MKRIFIVGSSASGKTTLAKQLGEIFNLPVYDLDQYYWLPAWQTVAFATFQTRVNAILAEELWIISGNYPEVQSLILAKADMLIWLDYSFFRCLYQGFRRSILRAFSHELCCNGNQETLKQIFFSRNSLPLWIVKSYWRYKKLYGKIFADKTSRVQESLRFTSPEKLHQWLENLSYTTKPNLSS